MTLKVIGAGFGRTGTLSLKSALEELGLGPCYHMVETRAHPEHDAMWLALARGEATDWRPMLKGYASTVDWPTTYFWKDLAAANPDAKIILTLRDPEAWYRSAAATIFARMLEFEALRADPADAVDAARRRHMEMVNTIVVEKTFGGRSTRRMRSKCSTLTMRRCAARCRTKGCLSMNRGEGWEPLCDFLGLPVPAAPYPKVNTTDDFVSRFPGKSDAGPATQRSVDGRDASLKDRRLESPGAIGEGDVMILGLSIAAFTKLHVAISLIGIVSGLVVLYGMLGARRMPGVDGAVPRHHRAHQRDRLHVPGRHRHARCDLRRHLAPRAGGGADRALCVPCKRRVALDLRRHGDLGALSQCVRARGAGLSEDRRPQSAGADRL